MLNVLIEGWRFLPHSYALVNQFQCIELLRRANVFHRDFPLAHPNWRHVRGLLDEQQEAQLAKIPEPPRGQRLDITFRIAFPYDMRPSTAARTAVFGTIQSALGSNFFLGNLTMRQAMAQSDALIVTPSNWSRARFVESGAAEERVRVVPHGVDPAIFRPPTPERRKSIRDGSGCRDSFVFLHIGAMTGNKNIRLLLRAFAIVAERHPHVRLVLKGVDPLYGSVNLLREAAQELTEAQMALVQPRIGYWGGVWPMAQMADLYHSADAYVSPYAAEGFNLPALEAAACGLPLICTAGGPSDEFTTPQFCLRIDSSMETTHDNPRGRVLVPRQDSLVAHMLRLIEDRAFRERAAVAGPQHVIAHYTWSSVVDRLLKTLVG